MKKLKFLSVIACIFMLNTACSSDSDDNSSATDPTPVVNAVTSGTWKVTSFIDSGTNETSHFTGYNFTFGLTNQLTATNGTNTYTGVWSANADDDDDDNPGGDLDFNIAFATPADFADLTEDWGVVSHTATTIALSHTSGGGGGTDVLVFEKN